MADDLSNPPSLSYVRLGPKATVREMAIAAACSRCSPQSGVTVRDIGRAIVDGLPAFYYAPDGSLTPLTPDHKYWSELAAYLTGKTTRTEVDASWNWVRDRPTYDPKTVAINRDWIDQVTVKRGDYVKFLRGQNELMPEWWFASTESTGADRSYSTPWLLILDAAIFQFFSPRRTPDPKRDEVVEWIKAKTTEVGIDNSHNLAAAIFTIIKPTDHQPRKRRDREKGLNPINPAMARVSVKG